MIELPNIVSFSGGQTSGYMLWRLMQSEPDFRDRFKVVFCNTGKEHDKTLDFVHDVETQWNVPVTWLEYTRIPAREIEPQLVPEGRKRANLLKAQEQNLGAHWFRVVNYETAARRFNKRTPFDELLEWSNVLPNVRTRMCSVQLKVRTRDRWLRAQGIGAFKAYIGIRKDEEHRKHEILANVDQHEQPQFPLCDDHIIKSNVDGFWAAHHFRLNIPNHMGNCDLCFLKARWKRVAAAKSDPKAARWWADWEDRFAAKGVTGDGALFRKGQSYAGIIADAEYPEFNFQQDEDIPCSCAVGGYRSSYDQD